MMIKLVVTDMDGTLLSKKEGLTKGNLEAINKLKENNIEFAIASGRDYFGVYNVMQQYGVDCEAIVGNGAQYCLHDGTVLMSAYMNKSVVKDVVEIFAARNIPYMIFTAQGFYTGYEPSYVRGQFIERNKRKFGATEEEFISGKSANAPCNFLKKVNDFDEFLSSDIDIIKVEAFSVDASLIPPTKEILKDIPTIAYLSSFDDNVEVTDEKAQKGLILEKVIEIKGLTKEEVIVLGDGMNDITLFECFPYSYAPSNAEETIKNLAYKVVCDCEDDGFKEAIEDMLIHLNVEDK